jgi:hypothetical protein
VPNTQRQGGSGRIRIPLDEGTKIDVQQLFESVRKKTPPTQEKASDVDTLGKLFQAASLHAAPAASFPPASSPNSVSFFIDKISHH